MEIKKSREADLDKWRLQGFLLGLVLVLALAFVALEWNSSDEGWSFFDADNDLEAELELSPLKRDKDEIPMMMPEPEKVEQPKSEQLNLVEETVDSEIADLPEVSEMPDNPDHPKIQENPEHPEVVDMYDEPVDFRLVEDLPQFPGGAAAFMKWLTKNLKYPSAAQRQKVKGRVVAQFIVNKDGSVSDIELVERLESSCDREVLRVLRMMPKWQAGVMDAKPCRTKVCIPIVFNL